MAEAKFVEWIKTRGGYVSPKISLFHDTGSGDRTVYANEALEEGEQLLLVAVQDTLHLSMPSKDATKDQEEEPSCTAAATAFLSAPQQQHLSPFLRTSLLLLAEMAKGADSAFAPYIENLPGKSDCLLHWGEEDLALLTGTSIEPQGRVLKQLFAEVVAPVLAAAPELYPAPYNTFQHFLRAADMTQTRAFHMVAENWVTGVSQENTEELYLIPAIDMLNHSTDPAQRNTQLLRFSAGTPLPLEGGKTLSSKGFFTMKADRSIPAGEGILHTYGDLSDAQLLQTYGFVQELGEPNPHNYALMPFGTLVEAVQALPEEAVELTEGSLAMKVQYLTKSGLLQAAAPRDTQFVLSCNEPLPDELLTTLQVLLLQEEELQELQQDSEPAAAGGSSAGAGSSKAGSSGSTAATSAPRLSLGTALLREEFGELVVGALVRALALAVERYPTSAAEDQKVLDSEDSGSRAWRAAFVAKGEKAFLAAAKVAALQLLFAAEDSDEEEDGDEDEEEDVDSELDEAEAAALAAAMAAAAEAAAGGGRAHSKRQRAAPAAAGAGAGSRGKKQKHGLGYTGQDDAKAAGGEEAEEAAAGTGRHKHHHHHRRHKHKKDHRAHFGAMTGPSEEDVWQSDDSEKVGYSESEGEEAAEGAAAAAAAGSKRKRRPRRPTGDPADPHRYEVAADGAVREVHGHMVGPDEADLVESDDSDKVGYA